VAAEVEIGSRISGFGRCHPQDGSCCISTDFDGTELHQAGENAIELWPSGREPVAGSSWPPRGGAWQQLVATSPPPQPVGLRADSPGPSDGAAAERAIREAFETVYSSDQRDEVRLAAIEGGTHLAATMEQARQARQAFRGTSEMEITVEAIRFIAEDEALVSFVLVFPAEPLSRLPSNGAAVLIDGDWRVARQTYCDLVQSLGVECPPEFR
jgi:hypothetical protein